MRLRFRWSTLLPLLAAFTFARAGEVEFKRVWPGWRDADSFERIGEYFGRAENPGRETIVRTQPADRGGYYFLVRVKSATAVPNARFEVKLIRPDSPDVKTFSFPTSIRPKETVFELGVTGADWPEGKKASPVAWKISLQSADGRVLAEHKSFLWEKPAKPAGAP